MPTQIAPTPIIRGPEAEKIYQEANQKRTEAAKMSAEKLRAKFDMIYERPNIADLRGKKGREIFETIKNSPKPDLTILKRKAAECERRIIEERNT